MNLLGMNFTRKLYMKAAKRRRTRRRTIRNLARLGRKNNGSVNSENWPKNREGATRPAPPILGNENSMGSMHPNNWGRTPPKSTE